MGVPLCPSLIKQLIICFLCRSYQYKSNKGSNKKECSAFVSRDFEAKDKWEMGRTKAKAYTQAHYYTSGARDVIELKKGSKFVDSLTLHIFKFSTFLIELEGDHCFDYYTVYKDEPMAKQRLMFNINNCRNLCRHTPGCKVYLQSESGCHCCCWGKEIKYCPRT